MTRFRSVHGKPVAMSGRATARVLRLLPVVLALLVATMPAHSAEDTDFALTTAAGKRLLIVSELSPLAINLMHGWRLHLLDTDGKPLSKASITVRGGMPEHDHGLPTEPAVTGEPEPGVYLLAGLRFHMPGRWLLEFDIALDGGAADSASLAFEL